MLGIDVSKDTLSAALMDPATRRVEWEATVPNTPAGIRSLLARTPVPHPLVLEPTGRFSLGVAQTAAAAGYTVLMAQPRRARAFLAAVQPRAKTDRLDSRGLAEYGCSARLAPYPLKSEDMDQLDQLLSARRGLAQALMQLRQQRRELPRAAAVLDTAIAGLVAQQKDLDRQIAQAAAALPAPAAAAHPAATPAASAPPVATAGDAPATAASSPAPTGTANFSLVAALDRVPGVGPVTAAALTSCLTSRSFPTPDAFVAYVGLDIKVRQSGKRKGQTALTKQGNAELRRLLYLCAQANLRRTDSPFQEQYAREQKKGLTTTAALVALARKLAKLAWSMAHYQTEFDPKRLYTQPNRRKTGSDPDSVP
jgi:transposase